MRIEIDSCLTKLLKGEYGLINDEEKEANIENRYFGGWGVVGRYKTKVGIIEINVLDACTRVELCVSEY